MIVLSVESSCDETSVSIIKDGIDVLSNIVLSQIDIHKAYGGVVPEIASREHIKGITMVFEEALKEAKIAKTDIDLVAVTKGPGLIGSLLIGVNAAKAFAFSNDIEIIGVHHIAGHIYANALTEELEFFQALSVFLSHLLFPAVISGLFLSLLCLFFAVLLVFQLFLLVKVFSVLLKCLLLP